MQFVRVRAQLLLTWAILSGLFHACLEPSRSASLVGTTLVSSLAIMSQTAWPLLLGYDGLQHLGTMVVYIIVASAASGLYNLALLFSRIIAGLTRILCRVSEYDT